MSLRGTALLIAALALLSCQESSTSGAPSPNVKGIVTGGIEPCGIVSRSEAHYEAGTVTVLKGQVTVRSTGPYTSENVFPTTVIAQENVAMNGTYRFVLDPGQYVLRARYSSGGDSWPFAEVTLRAGSNLKIDIPSRCK